MWEKRRRKRRNRRRSAMACRPRGRRRGEGLSWGWGWERGGWQCSPPSPSNSASFSLSLTFHRKNRGRARRALWNGRMLFQLLSFYIERRKRADRKEGRPCVVCLCNDRIPSHACCGWVGIHGMEGNCGNFLNIPSFGHLVWHFIFHEKEKNVFSFYREDFNFEIREYKIPLSLGGGKM